MRRWLTSPNGALVLSTIALLTFLGRGMMDWRYEFAALDPSGSFDLPGALVYMLLAGGWIWGLVAASNGRRGGLVAILVLALLLDVALGLATYLVFCPPWTGCDGWPNAWLWNWANLISGLIAAVTTALQLRGTRG